MTGLSHGEAQELHRTIGELMLTWDEGSTAHEFERALELAAILVSDTDPDTTAARVATTAQLRAVNAVRQERIWELEDRLATLRQASPLKNPMAVWDMFRRENRERLRLLERNRILTGKVLRRAQTIGQLRAANRALLAQITGGSHQLPE